MLIVGINHHKTPVAFREQLAFDNAVLHEALLDLNAAPNVDEVMILSTCNRSEIYVVMEKTEHATQWLKDWWCEYLNMSAKDSSDYFFHHWHRQAVHHLSRVAAGLDSMVLGEPQILGQLKNAYFLAQKAETVGQVLNQAIPHSFKVAKKIRTETEIGRYPVSVAFAAVTLAKRIFKEIKTASALLIGAGEMISLVARHLYDQGVKDIHILNRTQAHAEEIISALGISQTSGALVELESKLEDVDILVSCTGSREHIIHSDVVGRALKKRKHRPIYMVDLAVPRDIAPAVDQFEDIYLFTIDDLQQVIEENKVARSTAAENAEIITRESTEQFMQKMRLRETANIISDYRSQTEAIRQGVLERALKRIEQGESPEHVLGQMSRTLMNKLIHAPTLTMRHALESDDGEALKWSQKMLAIASDGQSLSDPPQTEKGLDPEPDSKNLNAAGSKNLDADS